MRESPAQHLNLWKENLGRVPDSVWEQTGLETLVLADNALSEVSEQIGRLKKLRRALATGIGTAVLACSPAPACNIHRLGASMDEDLDGMSREELIAEAKKLREGVRTHRDSTGHELCWHHPALWGLLPEQTDPQPTVPTWPEFLRGCLRYRQSLDEQLPDAPRSDVPYRKP